MMYDWLHAREQRRTMSRPARCSARALAGVLAATLAVHGCSLADLDGLSSGQDSQPATGDAGKADASQLPGTPPPPGADASTTTLGPGQIACASTTTVCDVRVAQCCVTLIGTSSAAARSLAASSAKCGPIGGPGCGQVTQSNDSFTDDFPQRCSTARDCNAGESCCVLPSDSTDRFGKFVASIACVSASECATTGRAICTGSADCSPQENCLPETDPVLVRLYASFCQ